MEKLIEIETAKIAREKGLKGSLDINGYLLGYSLKYKNPYPTGYKVFQSFPNNEEWLFAPTQSSLQRWLREKHNIFTYVDASGRPHIRDKNEKLLAEVSVEGKYSGFIYEEGLEIALKEALKLVD